MLTYVWCRFFVRKFLPAFLISLTVAILVEIFCYFWKRQRKSSSGLKIKEKEDAENMFLSLCFEKSPTDFFAKLVSLRYDNIVKHTNYIVAKKLDEKVVVWFESSLEPLGTARLFSIYKKTRKENPTKIIICCKEIQNNQVSTFCNNFDEKIIILDTYTTYQNLYKKFDCFPEITHKYSKEKKMVFKDFVAYSFNKKRTKGYLISALILIISSLFVRMNIYYCVISSLLVVFALISQFNTYFNTKNSAEIF